MSLASEARSRAAMSAAQYRYDNATPPEPDELEGDIAADMMLTPADILDSLVDVVEAAAKKSGRDQYQPIPMWQPKSGYTVVTDADADVLLAALFGGSNAQAHEALILLRSMIEAHQAPEVWRRVDRYIADQQKKADDMWGDA